MEWFSQNWFQVLTLMGIVLSWAVHYGISTQKWASMAKKVDLIENTLNEVQKSFSLHTNNSEIHVSVTLLQLLNERSDYIKQQFADTRADIQRIEALLNGRE